MRKARFEPAQVWMFDFRVSVGNVVELAGLCARNNTFAARDGNLQHLHTAFAFYPTGCCGDTVVVDVVYRGLY